MTATTTLGGRTMHRKFMGLGAVLLLLAVAAYGCGSSDTSVSSNVRQHVQAADGSQVRTVEYQGVAFDVPADWPVYDLASDPTMCVRFDVHAVYLGTPSPDMSCPAGGVGSTDAVLAQPLDQDTNDLGDTGDQVSAVDVHGLQARVSDQRASMGQLQADVGDVRVSITTGPDGDTLAQQILQSLRAASQ
jgi:hypothetical protein